VFVFSDRPGHDAALSFRGGFWSVAGLGFAALKTTRAILSPCVCLT